MRYIYITFLIFLVLIIFSRHCTRIFGAFFPIPWIILSGRSIFMNYNFWIKSLWVISTFLCIVLYLVLSKKIPYDFTRKIMSFRFLFNMFLPPKLYIRGGDRLIGRVLPYNKYQLRWNGRFVVNTELAAAGSALISGSVGSGKTYGILSMIRQNINQGHAVIFSEYKGDPKVIDELEHYATEHGYEVFRLSSGVSNFNYDPLRNLNNSGRIEAIINMRKWSLDGSDAHYKTSTQLLLQKTIQDFTHQYASIMEKMEQEGKDTKQISYTLSYFYFMKKYQAANGEQDAYVTVSKLLELLVTSSLEPMFKFKNEKVLALDELKNRKFLLITSFVSSNKELATSFSSLLFRDLLDEWTNEAPTRNTFLYIDEFGTLENPFIIKDILEKGRSGRIATTLSLQDINQIVIQTNEAYLNSILGTINTFIVYSGATRVTAEKFAGVQLADIEAVLMNLRKPINGHRPTAIYISKYPTLNRRITSEVFRFEPYIFDPKQKKTSKNGHIYGKKPVNNSLQSENEQIEAKKQQDMKALMEGNLTEEEMMFLDKQSKEEEKKEQLKIQSEEGEDAQKKKIPALKLHVQGIEDKNDSIDLNGLIFGDDDEN